MNKMGVRGGQGREDDDVAGDAWSWFTTMCVIIGMACVAGAVYWICQYFPYGT